MQLTARQTRIAAALIVAGGLVACAVATFSEQLGLGGEAARGTFGWRRISLLSVGAVVLAVGIVLLIRARPLSLDHWQWIERYLPATGNRQLRYLAVGLLALLGIVLVWTRLLNINASFWHDEVHTVLNYSGVGLGPILFGEGDYSINNHVLYNLLSWATTGVLGESEAMYRVWSVLPAIGAIAAATWWAWRRIGVVTAVAFAALAVAAPQHLDLAPQARGYGLALLAATLMLISADYLTRAYSKRTLLGLIGAGLVGIWTLHVFAVAFVGQGLALLRWTRLRRPVIAAVVLTAILSALFYAPVLRDTLAESRPRGETISLDAALLLDRPLGWLAVASFTLPFDVQYGRWMSLAAFALVVFAIASLWRRGEGGLALILVVPPLFFNLFIAVAGLSTVPRHQLLLLTHILLLVAVGIAELGRIVTQYRPLRPVAIGVGVLAVLVLSGATLDREHERAPYEDFKQVAQIVSSAGAGPIVTDTMRPDGFRYYLGDDLLELHPDGVESLLCARRRELVYIRHVPLSPLATDYRAPASLDCLTGEDSVRVRVPQRGRGTAIDVWFINPRVNGEVVDEDLPNAPEPWIQRVWGEPDDD